MKIPVFVSCPSALTSPQIQSRKLILYELDELKLEPRSLGRSDYSIESPVNEVLTIARRCAGGIVPGFTQFVADAGTWKKGVKDEEKRVSKPIQFPTPWNQLASGIMYALRLRILIFRESAITGGIFDLGSSDVFVREIPIPLSKDFKKEELKQILLKWFAKVRQFYYYGDEKWITKNI